MNFSILIMKWRDLPVILVIIVLTTIAWSGVLNQMISGEGYYYFSPTISLIVDGKLTDLTHNIDNFPRLIYFVLEKLFGGEMQPYMNFMFLIIILVNITIYWLTRSITKSSSVAFLATIFGGINFISNFQFYARGHYQWFMQRVPEIIPIFIGFYFLFLFFDKKRSIHYILSLAFYIFAMFLNYYTTLSLSLYLSLILSSSILQLPKYKKSALFIGLSIPFIIITALFNSGATLSFSTIKPNQSFLQSLFLDDIINKIFFQLTIMTWPLYVKEVLANLFNVNLKDFVSYLILPSLLMYTAIIFFLFKRKLKYFNFILGAFIAVLAHLYLNVYLGRVNVFNEIFQGRYYYNPSIYLGFFWASFFYEILKPLKAKKVLFLFSLALITGIWVTLNSLSIWKHIRDSQYEYTGGRKMLKILSQNKNSFPANSLVMLPQPLMPLGEDFLKKHYSRSQTKFLYIDSKWKEKIPKGFDLNKLFVFDFNDEFNKGGRSDLSKIEVVDYSNDYRQMYNQKEVDKDR